MTIADVVPAFLSGCPTIDPAWQEYLESWHGEPERGNFNDIAVVASHLVDCFEQGDVSEYPAVFALLEKCLAEGDELVQNLVTVGLIEDIQNIASHRPFGPQVFYEWLGPLGRAEWNQLCVLWEQVAEAKAAGLLEPRSGDPSPPPIDPSQVEDPALRRILESIYRK